MTNQSCAAACLLLLAACSGAGDGAAGDRASLPLEPTTRDSAGVTLYEHPADALSRAPLLMLDSVPLAVFAGDVDDPTKDVSALQWPIFLSSGAVMGYDRQAKQLLVLDATTGGLTRRGRSGNGPLELGSPSRFVRIADDSVIFTDGRNDRVVIAHQDSGVVHEFSRQVAAGLSSSGVLGRLSDNAVYLLTMSGAEVTAPGGRANYARQLGIWQVGEDSVRTLFSVPTGWLVWETMGDGGRAGYGLAFAPQTSIGVWSNGFLVARGETWALERWDAAGVLREVVRVNLPSQLVDDALFERFVQTDVDEMAANMEGAGVVVDRDSIAASVRARGHADTLAAYGLVNVSPNGTMWVLDYAMPGDTGWTATAVAPDGRMLGRIMQASGTPPIAWGDDRVAIRTEDADGIATITIRRVLGLP